MGNHPFEDLPALMRKHAGQIATMVNLAAQRVALAAGDSLARDTPVDTGVARSNWVATVDAPFSGVIPAYFPWPSYRLNHHEAVKQLSISVTRPKVRTRLSGASRPGRYGVP